MSAVSIVDDDAVNSAGPIFYKDITFLQRLQCLILPQARDPVKKIGLGLFIGICIPVLCGFIFLKTGGMPVATKGRPLPFERMIAKMALHEAFKGQEDKPSPIPADEINLKAGAKVYSNHCAVCHGLPGGQPTFTAKGLFPKPPQLFQPDHGVTDDPVGESYWKVKNGIRLTGMPGYVDNLSESEMWQVSLLVFSADKLPPSVLEILQAVK